MAEFVFSGEDNFEDIVAKDPRFEARAYGFLSSVVSSLIGDKSREVSGEEILEEFKETALDKFGPLSYTVLTEWGIKCTEDIGEMISNLVEGRRFRRGENDNPEAFVGGYDFKETFLAPYQA